MIQRVRLSAIAVLLAATACMSDQPTGPMANAKKVNPPATPLPLTDSIRVSPLTVPAGSPATGIITLKSPAPAGGIVIQLFTNLPLTATLPATVTAPAGAKIVTFPIETFVGFPNSTTTPRIDANINGVLIGTGVNVVTGASTTPPALAIASVVLSPATVVGGNTVQGTINLNAAAPAGGALVSLQSTNTAVGAASYTIQIADNSNFSSTIVSQDVAASQFATSALPTKTMWWRVRANSPSGTAGSFSASRRFEVK